MAWKDQRGVLRYGNGLSDPVDDKLAGTDWLIPFFKLNTDGVINVSFPMSHEWDPRRAIRPHFILIPGAAGTGNVVIRFRYTWTEVGNGLPAGNPPTEQILNIPIVPTDLHKQKIVRIGELYAPAGIKEGDLFAMQIRRHGLSDAADTYTQIKTYGNPQANLGMPIANIKFEPVKAGTQNQFGPV